MKDMILDYIKKEYLDEDEADDMTLDEHTPLISSGIVDSFSMVSLKRFLEKKYEIRPCRTRRPRRRRSDTVTTFMALVNKHWRRRGPSHGVPGGRAGTAWQAELRASARRGSTRKKRFIHSPQAAHIRVEFPSGAELKEWSTSARTTTRLSSHPEVIAAAHSARRAAGTACPSVRFICGHAGRGTARWSGS